MTKKPESEFEEGKPMEEYADDSKLVDELNNLKIDPEPNPDVETRLETVVEEPVRNEKKKPIPQPKKEDPKIAPVEVPVTPNAEKPVQPIVEQPKISEPQPPIQEAPQPQQQAPPEVKFNGIDDYIARAGQQIEENYAAAGKEARKQFINNSYNNLLGIISGEYVVVPRQAVQQQPAAEQTPQQNPVESEQSKPITIEDLRSTIEEVVDKKISAKTVLPEQTQQQQPSTTVNPKVVKPKGKWSLKSAALMAGVFLMIGIAIIVTYGLLNH